MNLTAPLLSLALGIILFSQNVLSQAPSNNACVNATLITTDSTCVTGTSRLTGQTLANATGDGGLITSSCTAVNSQDVWYKFVAKTQYPTITVSSLGSSWGTSLKVQLLSGSCGAFTEVACANNTAVTPAVSNPLTPGTTYYIRVYKNTTTNPTGSNWGFTICVTDPLAKGGRMNEVFSRTILSAANVIEYPWEITYGKDGYLWITDARAYKVYRMNASTGVKTTVLDLNSSSTDLSGAADSLRAVGLSLTSSGNWSSTVSYWPQGGLAGLTMHPQFGDGTGHDFVYIGYVHRHLYTAASSGGIFFRNKLVRFTYNSATGKLGSPAVLCDTLPGGQDHNSQRMIIAPVNGTNYLFYASGDMGGGQYSNRYRPIKAQNIDSYEGKILRFNLEPDNDGDSTVPNAWIPDDNPFNSTLGEQSAVYSTGIRNNQGFAYDPSLNILYGSSHGAFSDDEINIIEPGKNYGHPLIIGFDDGNYNGITAGSAPGMGGSSSSAPAITNEAVAASAIGSTYKNPLFSAYTTPTPVSPSNYTTVSQLWNGTNGSTNIWPSEAWSGLDIYTHTLIPGWKRSLIAAGLKFGRLIRLKLGATGTTTLPSNLAYGNTNDTITYFQSANRYRDLAFAPNGKDVFIIMDKDAATSGPGVGNPIVPSCAGCVIKYSFLGYANIGGKSSIPTSIDVTAGTANACQNATTITIDATNNNLWVPITGQDGNILAEIKANGNNLGTVTTSFYTKTGLLRETSAKKLYASRNITITPQNQPTSPVDIRLYLTAAEYNNLRTSTNSVGASSGVNSIGDVVILKNPDACGSALVNNPITITPQYAESFGSNYVLQGTITSFSSFYLGSPNSGTLPLQLLTFTGSLLENNSALLQWTTANEINTSHFVVERSIDGNNFSNIGTVNAAGDRETKTSYSFTDLNAGAQPASIVYYRLKIFDNDGKYSYSKVISIVLNRNIKVMLFPNPAKHNLNVQVKGAVLNPVMIQVSDLNGRIIYSEKRNVNQSNTVTIDVKQWKPQVYILKVTNAKNEVISTQKFEKM